MASTITGAFEQIKGLALDMAIGLEKARPEPTPAEVDIEMAFSDFDIGTLDRMASTLAAACRESHQDAEDAVQSGCLELLERRPDLYRQDPDSWMGLLYTTSRFHLLRKKRYRFRVASTEAVFGDRSAEALADLSDQAPAHRRDRALLRARPCVEVTRREDERARLLPRPEVGFRWAPEQIVGAIANFRDFFGHPPKWDDFKAINGLPSPTTVCRHFGSLAEAVLAAGMTPASGGVRRRPYEEEEAVRECRVFREREGRWPDRVDVRQHSDRLPPASALKRFFGGDTPCDVQQGVERFLRKTPPDA